MIQTIVTPLETNFEMTVVLPLEYVGKKVRILFYTDEEADEAPVFMIHKKKPSDFFGTLSQEEGEKMQEYIIQSRNEWERNI